jgi:hypothetical protein
MFQIALSNAVTILAYHILKGILAPSVSGVQVGVFSFIFPVQAKQLLSSIKTVKPPHRHYLLRELYICHKLLLS